MTQQHDIWIDLDNTPHVPFFRPIITALQAQGYAVTVTARDAYNVRSLLDLHKLDCRVIGRHSGKNKILKGFGLLLRAVQLLSYMAKRRPSLAVSHGSRAQVLAAKVLKIPSIIIADYEHVAHVARPDYLIVPDVIPSSAMQGLSERVLKYPGIKEDVYASNFSPDPSILKELGISPEELLVVTRPPASEAHYHNHRSDEVFDHALKVLMGDKRARVVVLPRTPQQENEIRSCFAQFVDQGKIILPRRALDGLNLIWHSDFVISGGGTMNREASALGVPVYSTFCGQIGAVDKYLQSKGRLVLLQSLEDVNTRMPLVKRARLAPKVTVTRTALDAIVSHLACAVCTQVPVPGLEAEKG